MSNPQNMDLPFEKNKLLKGILALLGIGVLVVLYRTAWLCDDAYITYRSVDNFVNGFGLTYNPGWRVQAFTHPLWALAHIPFRLLSGNMYAIGLFVSISVTLAAAGLLVWRMTDYTEVRIFLLAAMISSAAFMDFSTSGLENPMSHLLLVLFSVCLLSKDEMPRRIFWASLIGGLMVLNRMDTLLLVAPSLGFLWWQKRSLRAAGWVLLGVAPFILWECIALVYYGFPFPMSAYAKLNTSLERGDLLLQGMHYFVDTLMHDPFTLMIILGGIALPFLQKRTSLIPFSIGIFLYLLYTWYIGGDFMRGRFFCTPFFLSLIIWGHVLKPRYALILAPVSIILGLLGNAPPMLSHADFGKVEIKENFIAEHGIANERAFYFQATGLIVSHGEEWPDHKWVSEGKRVRNNPKGIFLSGTMGFVGYYAGPEQYIIDRNALTEPFLAQLPNVFQPTWRPGHNTRLIPSGYIKTLSTNKNEFMTPALRKLYSGIERITRGSVWDPERFGAIWDMNLTDKFTREIDLDFYTLPVVITLSEKDLEGTKETALVTHMDAGFEIQLSDPNQPESLVLYFQNDCEYICVFRNEKRIIASHIIVHHVQDKNLTRARVLCPDEPFDNIVVYPNDRLHPCKIQEISLIR